MQTKNKIPFINENETMKEALKIINKKKLGFLVVTNTLGLTKGVFTDGDLKRLMQKKDNISNAKIKSYMSKNPYCVEERTLASEVLSQMNKKKITESIIPKNFIAWDFPSLWKVCQTFSLKKKKR